MQGRSLPPRSLASFLAEQGRGTACRNISGAYLFAFGCHAQQAAMLSTDLLAAARAHWCSHHSTSSLSRRFARQELQRLRVCRDLQAGQRAQHVHSMTSESEPDRPECGQPLGPLQCRLAFHAFITSSTASEFFGTAEAKLCLQSSWRDLITEVQTSQADQSRLMTGSRSAGV